MRVAYLGPEGSFTHSVGRQIFEAQQLIAYESITDVIKAYERGEVDFAIVPVENTIEGTVHETVDYLFHQADIKAIAELIRPIKQQLMATSIDKPITTIFSHPQAVAQGKSYLLSHYPKATIELTASTAYAARHVAAHPDQPYAAIAPQEAAETYGLAIIAKDIQAIDKNFTRFWVLGQAALATNLNQTEQKLTLGVTLPDNQPGALYKALSVFAWRGIDLTKIQSRPLKTVLGEYFFIIDVDNSRADLTVYALEELAAMGIQFKVLGVYGVYGL